MKKILLYFTMILIVSCSSNENKTQEKRVKETNPNELKHPTEYLPDSIFGLKNIEIADLIFKVKFIDNKLYNDSTKKIEFTELSDFYKQKIIVPILSRQLGVSEDYAKNFMISYFISSQDCYEKYQPITIWISGDDYSSLVLATIDSAQNLISSFLLNGGLFPGPYELNDSLSNWGENRYSIINKNKIKTFCINTNVWTDNRNEDRFIDSISYENLILPNGKIETKMLDSVRYKK